MSNVVHDLIDKLVEIEDGADFLRCLLQPLQVLDLLAKQGANGRGTVIVHCPGNSGHRTNLQKKRPRTTLLLRPIRCSFATSRFFLWMFSPSGVVIHGGMRAR